MPTYRRRRRYTGRRKSYNRRVSYVQPQSSSSRYSGAVGTIAKYGPPFFNMASKAIGIASGLRSLINAESKFFDVANPLNAPVYIEDWVNSSNIPLGNMVQGYTQSTRTGNTIKVKSLQVRLKITVPYLLNQIPPAEFRVVICLGHALSGASPLWTDMYQTYAGSSASSSPGTIQTRNIPKSKLYTILDDKFIRCVSQNTSYQAYSVNFNYYKKFGDLHLDFLDGGAAATSLMNSLFMFVIQDNHVNANAGPQLFYNCRLRYYDN
nr:MAG: capsid protein [Cressdnaviricota sp.]